MPKRVITIYLDDDLLHAIDRARKQISRNRYIVEILGEHFR